MHRCLLLHISGELDEAIELARQDMVRRAKVVERPLRSAFVSAPAAGVGNLSSPVEVLKKRLWEDVRSALADLLRAQPGERDPFTLDIILVGDFGAPNAVEALSVCLDAVRENLNVFGSVFPDHEVGVARRWRVYVAGFLGMERRSDERRGALRGWLESLQALGSGEDGRQRYVDRVFVLDSVTPRGICATDELAGQLINFCRLLLSGEMRNSEGLSRSLVEPGRDLLASAGCVRANIPIVAVRRRFTFALTQESVESMKKVARLHLAPAGEMLPHSLDEEPALKAVAHLRERIMECLLQDGVEALTPLQDWLLRILDVGQEQLDTVRKAAESEENTPQPTRHGLVWAVSGVLAALAYAASIFLVGASAMLSAGASLGVLGVVAALMYLGFAASQPEAKKKETKPEPEDDPRERFMKEVMALRNDLASMQNSLRTAATPAIEADQLDEGKSHPWSIDLGSEEIAKILFETAHPFGSGKDTMQSFVESIGGWERLFTTREDLMVGGVQLHCERTLDALSTHAMLSNKQVLNLLEKRLRDFFETWKSGVSVHLDLNSRQIHDPDGIRGAAENLVVAPLALTQIVQNCVAETLDKNGTQGAANAQKNLYREGLEDVWIVTIAHDIHLDAVPTLHLSHV